MIVAVLVHSRDGRAARLAVERVFVQPDPPPPADRHAAGDVLRLLRDGRGLEHCHLAGRHALRGCALSSRWIARRASSSGRPQVTQEGHQLRQYFTSLSQYDPPRGVGRSRERSPTFGLQVSSSLHFTRVAQLGVRTHGFRRRDAASCSARWPTSSSTDPQAIAPASPPRSAVCVSSSPDARRMLPAFTAGGPAARLSGAESGGTRRRLSRSGDRTRLASAAVDAVRGSFAPASSVDAHC